MKIAICVITYNRINSLKRLLRSLSDAYYEKDIPLIISVDRSDTTEIENFADSYSWPYGTKIVSKQNENLGLRRHILQCGEFLEEYDALVVLEDDIEVAPSFFYYVCACVDRFCNDNTIAGISLYSFAVNYHNNLPFSPVQTNSDVYLMQCAQSWGQVWMRKQWKEFRCWYEQNCEEFGDMPYLPKTICSWPKSSWLKYHTRFCIEKNKYFVYPYCSLSTNYADVGEHSTLQISLFQTTMLQGLKKQYNLNATVKYDGFFENEVLYDILGLSKDQLCIDIYGQKGNRMCCRYYLTTQKMNFKVVSSYGIMLRPIEMNVIKGIEGEGIYLYDTSFEEDNSYKDGRKERDLLLYNIADLNNSIFQDRPHERFRTLLKRNLLSYTNMCVKKIVYVFVKK